MIVMDASAMVEALVGRDVESELLDLLSGEVVVPHLLDVEVLSALRGLVLGGVLTTDAAHLACTDYFSLALRRQETAPLADRIWQLRNQFTAYDACYIALAEGMDIPLVTCDRKLRSGGHAARVLVFGTGG